MMKPIEFGVCLPIFARPGGDFFRVPNFGELDAPAVMAMGVRAEVLGYDSLWVADHLMLGKDEAILEGWTVISALAGATSRAKLGMIHEAVLFRNPALAAKMASTLDLISGGRLIHFMDCGFSRREYVNYGLPWDDDEDVRMEMLGEATELILKLWTSDEPVTHTGKHYRTHDAVNTPKPVQRPHPPIWFGEARSNVLDLCARYGQGWNTTPASLPELRRRLDLLREACLGEGRAFDEIEISLEMQIMVSPDLAGLRAQLEAIVDLAKVDAAEAFPTSLAATDEFRAFIAGETDELPRVMAEEWIAGTAAQVDARVRAYIAEGVSHFMLWFQDAPEFTGMEFFAHEIAPRFREN